MSLKPLNSNNKPFSSTNTWIALRYDSEEDSTISRRIAAGLATPTRVDELFLSKHQQQNENKQDTINSKHAQKSCETVKPATSTESTKAKTKKKAGSLERSSPCFQTDTCPKF